MSSSHSIRDLVILHLGAYQEFIDEEEVPYQNSPSSISQTLDITLNRCYEVISELEKKGFIFQDRRKTKKSGRKRKVYFLTEQGKKRENEIREELEDETVELDGNEVIEEIQQDEDLPDESKKTLIGREEEIERLKELLEEAQKDRCRAVFIEGETGLGKSRLLSELKDIAEERGFKVLRGYCKRETLDPYFPFREALKDIEGVEKELSDIFSSRSEEIEVNIADKESLDAERRTTFFRTTELLREIAAEQPLVISIDDIQWADKGTLKLFHYMTDKLKESPVFLAATYREGDVEPGDPLKDTIQRMARKHLHHEIKLTPLGKAETRETLEKILETDKFPEDLVGLIHEKTNGNPLFMREIIEEMIDEDIIDPKEDRYPESEDDFIVPGVIKPVVKKRVMRLDDWTRDILQWGSVIGGRIPLILLQECTGMGEMELLDHIESLIDTKIWEETGERDEVEFTHGLIEEIIYDGLGEWLEKKYHHRTVAEAMKTVYGLDFEDIYSEIARHFEKGEEYHESFKYYVEAAEVAERVYAHEDAVDMYESALAQSSRLRDLKGTDMLEKPFEGSEGEIDEIDILERVSGIYSLLGDYEKARTYLDDALDRLGIINKKERLVEKDIHFSSRKMKLLRKMGETWLEQGEYERVLKTTERALSLETGKQKVEGEEEHEVSKERSESLSVKGRAIMRMGDYERSLKIFREEKETAEDMDDIKALGQAHHDLGSIYLQKGELEKAEENFKEAIELRERSEERRLHSKSLNNLGVLYHIRGELDQALEYWNKALNTLRTIGDERSMAALLNNIGELYFFKGDLERAADNCRECLDISEKIGSQSTKAMVLLNLGRIFEYRGKTEEALERYERGLEIADEFDDSLRKGEALGLIGSILETKGKFDEALEKHEQSLDILEEMGIKRAMGSSLRRTAELYREMDDTESAIEYHSRALDLSEKTNHQIEIVMNLCGLAESRLIEGDTDEAADNIKRAQDMLEDVDVPLRTPRISLVLGMVEREEGDLDEAEKMFKLALDQSEEMDLRKDRVRALYELGRSLKNREDQEARDMLEEVIDLTEKMGWNTLKDKTESILDSMDKSS
ncbi:MAG: tetratricopeptide repeat protein [Candidatus Thermoplasmatota archaeon]|nr:tetratricopeptide repeat protein [Candidatus Thermoplasmatota archaeon]